MFTGIITDIGTVKSIQLKGDTRIIINSSYDMDSVAIGASIACSGCCLTVVEKAQGWFAVDASAETLSKTAPNMWVEGAKLNLERALKVGDELGGHIVTGHVDGVGEVTEWREEGGSHRLSIKIPGALAPYVAGKGSITIDGVSLTVNTVEDSSAGCIIGLNIIPHTSGVTTLGDFLPGRHVNLEIDVLARYLKRMEDMRSS